MPGNDAQSPYLQFGQNLILKSVFFCQLGFQPPSLLKCDGRWISGIGCLGSVGQLEICTHPQQLCRPSHSLVNGTLRTSSLSTSRPSSLTEMEQTRGGDVLPLFRHQFTRHHPPGPAGSLFIYFSSHLFCSQPISYQSSSPSHNQNLPRVDARASNLSFPQRLATGLEMIRE